MNNDWSFKYDCIMKEYNIPTYAARDIHYNAFTNETILKFTWTTIEKGIEDEYMQVKTKISSAYGSSCKKHEKGII